MKAKKYWGQNFLNNEIIAAKIIDSADISSADNVLEIGPGKGILTFKLAGKGARLLAVEIDPDLVFLLNKAIAGVKNIKIIEGDILKINLPKLLEDNFGKLCKYKVVANIPYYITGPILRLLLESETPPKEIILMVQKEVAERIVARPGKMSLLSVSVQYFAKAEILFHVPRKLFLPEPEVDSTVIRISNIKNIKSKKTDSEFFRVVRAGFSSKRKTLANNLSASFHLEKYSIENILSANGFNVKIRAQELGIEDWGKISRVINN